MLHTFFMFKKQMLLCCALIVPFLFLFSNPGNQEKIVEVIEVVNIEVVVRVYQDGSPQPVSGLQKKDFKLIVNGKEKEIHGFFEERKKIAAPPPSPQKTKALAWEMLQAQSDEMKKKIKQMEMEIYQLTSDCETMDGPKKAIDTGLYFQERYAQIKNDFMQSYFNPGVKEYTAIAEYLRVKKNKKWVLIFYQPGVFPEAIRKAGDIPEVPEHVETRLLNSIGKNFINTGATVHTLLMMTPHMMGNLPEGFEYQYSTTQSETILRNITKRTGGSHFLFDPFH